MTSNLTPNEIMFSCYRLDNETRQGITERVKEMNKYSDEAKEYKKKVKEILKKQNGNNKFIKNRKSNREDL